MIPGLAFFARGTCPCCDEPKDIFRFLDFGFLVEAVCLRCSGWAMGEFGKRRKAK